jgi:hypothetical protein
MDAVIIQYEKWRHRLGPNHRWASLPQKVTADPACYWPNKNCNGYIALITCLLKIFNGFHRSRYLSSQKIETVILFSLTVALKNCNVSIVLVTYPHEQLKQLHLYHCWLLKRCNGSIVLVTNIKLKLLLRSRFWAPKKVVGFWNI